MISYVDQLGLPWANAEVIGLSVGRAKALAIALMAERRVKDIVFRFINGRRQTSI
jgi:hypothetical protein